MLASGLSAFDPARAGHRSPSGRILALPLSLRDAAAQNVGMTGELYALGWRVPGQTRQWIWAVFPSLADAVRVARAYAKLDGGGRWRVYGTRVVAASGSVREVRDRVLAEGVERPDGR